MMTQVANFQFNKMPPLSSNGWFKALYRRFDSTQFPGEFPSQVKTLNPQGLLFFK
jgi:hypothetical protein